MSIELHGASSYDYVPFFYVLATQYVFLLHSSGRFGQGQIKQHIARSSGYSRLKISRRRTTGLGTA